jgi:tRNA (cytidine/uridine-2'-O-)-methyltransferase
MFHVVLHQPEIPPNTGNVLRLCAVTGCRLHLVRPLGFALDDRSLARAGLDYADISVATVHDDWARLRAHLAGGRLFAFSTRAHRRFDEVRFERGDSLVFGAETRGLPESILDELGTRSCLRLPMLPGCRSLNLSNAVAVAVYAAWRQAGFAGAQ